MRFIKGMLLVGLVAAIAGMAGVSKLAGPPVGSTWNARATTKAATAQQLPPGFYGLAKQIYVDNDLPLYNSVGAPASDGTWLPKGYPTAEKTLHPPTTTRRFWTMSTPNPWLIYVWEAPSTSSMDSIRTSLPQARPYLAWRFMFQKAGTSDPFFCNPLTGMNLVCDADQAAHPEITQLVEVRVRAGWYPLYPNSWIAVYNSWLPTNFPNAAGMLGPNSPSIIRRYLAVPTGNHDFMQVRASPFTDSSPVFLMQTKMLKPAGTTTCDGNCPHSFPGRFVSR